MIRILRLNIYKTYDIPRELEVPSDASQNRRYSRRVVVPEKRLQHPCFECRR